jgi:hypothetical protein
MKNFCFIKNVVFFVALLTLSLYLSGQVHFTRNWTGYGLDHMNFYIIAATINDVNMQPGDEIAVFDGNECVGVSVLTEELTGGSFLSIIASRDDGDTPERDGYIVGHVYSLRVWDESAAEEINDVAIDILAGSGTFGIGEFASLNVSATSSVPPNSAPVVSDIPDQTIDEGSNFMTINLDDHVSDVETADADIIWTFSGNIDLMVSIDDRVASVSLPDENWNGSETITFTATDDDGVNPLSDSDAATFNVNAVNDPPVITGQNTISVNEDESRILSISDFIISDADDPLDPFTLTVNSGSNYTVSGTTITPAANFNGMLTVPVTASDGAATSNTFDATITVIPVNDMPVAADIPDQTIGQGDSFSSINLDQYVSDIETADVDIAWTCSEDIELIVAIADRIATITVPDENWIGSDTIIFTCTDDDPVNPLSDSDTVTFMVTDANSAPVVNNIPDQTILEGDAFETINLDDFVNDEETPDENITWEYTGNSELIITITNHIAAITVPDEDWFGSETVTFTATDDDTEVTLSGSDMCLFTVTGVNDSPESGEIPDQLIDVDEIFVPIMLDDYVEDIETADSNLSWICSGNKDLKVTITDRIAEITKPDANWTGSEILIFTVTDNDPENPLSDSCMVTFTVIHTNEAPILSQIPDQTIEGGGSFEAIYLDDYVNDTETSDENIKWSCSGNSHVLVEISNRVATFTLSDPKWSGSDTIIFTALDDDLSNPLSASKTAIFTVTGSNVSGFSFPMIERILPYPNPTERFVMLTTGDYAGGKLTIEIISVNGEILSVENYEDVHGQLEIDMNAYYPGIYFIRVITPDITSTSEIMKQ